MQEYGYQILQALVTDMDPDQRVKGAMNEINASKRLREAATNKAEADKIMQVCWWQCVCVRVCRWFWCVFGLGFGSCVVTFLFVVVPRRFVSVW